MIDSRAIPFVSVKRLRRACRVLSGALEQLERAVEAAKVTRDGTAAAVVYRAIDGYILDLRKAVFDGGCALPTIRGGVLMFCGRTAIWRVEWSDRSLSVCDRHLVCARRGAERDGPGDRTDRPYIEGCGPKAAALRRARLGVPCAWPRAHVETPPPSLWVRRCKGEWLPVCRACEGPAVIEDLHDD